MSQQEIIRYRCPNVNCPTRRGPGNSWWERTENDDYRCPFCFTVYTQAQLDRERQNHINLIRGRQPASAWPNTMRSHCSHCNRQTMTLYGPNSNGPRVFWTFRTSKFHKQYKSDIRNRPDIASQDTWFAGNPQFNL